MIKFVRFIDSRKTVKWGAAYEDEIRELSGDPFGDYSITKTIVDPTGIKILAPSEPSKIVAVGLNYRKHTSELDMKLPDEPVLFIKPPSSVVGHLDSIVYPDNATRVDYEAELAVVIRNTCRNVPEDNVNEFILGYTCLNDVTERDMQKKDGQWTRAKSFDTFAPMGPYIACGIEPADLGIRCILNGKTKQSSSTSELVFDTKKLISFISRIMTLFPGDVVSTGTPEGVGPMKRGDRVEVEIEKIGKLINFVI